MKKIISLISVFLVISFYCFAPEMMEMAEEPKVELNVGEERTSIADIESDKEFERVIEMMKLQRQERMAQRSNEQLRPQEKQKLENITADVVKQVKTSREATVRLEAKDVRAGERFLRGEQRSGGLDFVRKANRIIKGHSEPSQENIQSLERSFNKLKTRLSKELPQEQKAQIADYLKDRLSELEKFENFKEDHQQFASDIRSYIDELKGAKEQQEVSIDQLSDDDLAKIRAQDEQQLKEKIRKEMDEEYGQKEDDLKRREQEIQEREKSAKQTEERERLKREAETEKQRLAKEQMKVAKDIQSDVIERMNKPDEKIRVAKETFVGAMGELRGVDFEQYKVQVMRQGLDRVLIGYGKMKSQSPEVVNEYRTKVLADLRTIRDEWAKGSSTLQKALQDSWLRLEGKDAARSLKSILDEGINLLENKVNAKNLQEKLTREGSLINEASKRLKAREGDLRDYAIEKEGVFEASFEQLQGQITDSIAKFRNFKKGGPEQEAVKKQMAQVASEYLKAIDSMGIKVSDLGVGFRPEVVRKFKEKYGIDLTQATGKPRAEDPYFKSLEREKNIINTLRRIGLDKWVPKGPKDIVKIPARLVGKTLNKGAQLIGYSVMLVGVALGIGAITLNWILSPLWDDSADDSDLDDDLDLDDDDDDDSTGGGGLGGL